MALNQAQIERKNHLKNSAEIYQEKRAKTIGKAELLRVEKITAIRAAQRNGLSIPKTLDEIKNEKRGNDNKVRREIREMTKRMDAEVDSWRSGTVRARVGSIDTVHIRDVPNAIAALGLDCRVFENENDPRGWWLWFASAAPKGDDYAQKYQTLSQRRIQALGCYGLSMWLKMATSRSAHRFERLICLFDQSMSDRNEYVFKICCDAMFRGVAAISLEGEVRTRVGDNAEIIERFEDENSNVLDNS